MKIQGPKWQKGKLRQFSPYRLYLFRNCFIVKLNAFKPPHPPPLCSHEFFWIASVGYSRFWILSNSFWTTASFILDFKTIAFYTLGLWRSSRLASLSTSLSVTQRVMPRVNICVRNSPYCHHRHLRWCRFHWHQIRRFLVQFLKPENNIHSLH